MILLGIDFDTEVRTIGDFIPLMFITFRICKCIYKQRAKRKPGPLSPVFYLTESFYRRFLFFLTIIYILSYSRPLTTNILENFHEN